MRLNDREAPILRDARRLFALRRWFVLRLNSGALRDRNGRLVELCPEGTADLLAIVPRSGRWLAAEVKRPRGGRIGDAQRAFNRSVREQGGVALFVSDLAVLNRVIDRLEADPWAILDEFGNLLTTSTETLT